MGTTLGGDSTLGGGSKIGGGSTFGDVVCLGVGSTIGGWDGKGISEVADGFQYPKRSRSLARAYSWSWCDVARASLIENGRNLRAWTIRSSGVSVGWLR